jgi:hypothetical protein
MGPVYSLIVRFQGMKCGREIIPGHANRVLGGAIRVIDLVIITRDEAGELVKVGAKTGKDRGVTPSGVRGGTPTGGFSEGGGEVFAIGLAGKNAATLLPFENVRAIRVEEAVKNADSGLIDTGGIPPEAIQ